MIFFEPGSNTTRFILMSVLTCQPAGAIVFVHVKDALKWLDLIQKNAIEKPCNLTKNILKWIDLILNKCKRNT